VTTDVDKLRELALQEAPGPWARNAIPELLDAVAERDLLREKLRFCGGTLLPDGSLRLDMRRFNAAHRCEQHRDADYKSAPEWDRCTQCLADDLDAANRTIDRLEAQVAGAKP
jgi:hypothetical protein